MNAADSNTRLVSDIKYMVGKIESNVSKWNILVPRS